MKILISCPIYKRHWILKDWFLHIEKQTVPLSDLGFIFELGPRDAETHKELFSWHAKHPEVQVFDATVRENVQHKQHTEGRREWKHSDYEKMAYLRNHLLDKATALKPERFYSLDCDIFLEDPRSLEYLYALTETRPAVSTLSYMFQYGIDFPSVMTWVDKPGGKAKRFNNTYPLGTIFKTDVIMASKMMRPEVYSNIRYRYHPQGEDLGWSAECAKHNMDLYCASNIYTPHIMHKYALVDYREHGDNRGPTILAYQ